MNTNRIVSNIPTPKEYIKNDRPDDSGNDYVDSVTDEILG